MIIQAIVNIAEICARKGIKNIILSPGSRCAHLTIAFVRHPEIKTYTIADERSAAFIALGMSQKLNEPVALLCTSGTAALNYYPAIVEAFYQNVPLVVFTADRPDEWVDQLDGQTIRQRNVYANHIKKSYQLPVDYSHEDAVWYSERSVNEAINIASFLPKGPVHINVPIREPFYPEETEEIVFDKSVRVINHEPIDHQIPEKVVLEILKDFSTYERIVILVGQNEYDEDLIRVINDFSEKFNIPVIADVISNVPIKTKIDHLDITLFDRTLWTRLKPEMIISFGKSLLSKNLKLFLRKCKTPRHIHLQYGVEIADYSQSIGSILNVSAITFFKQILDLGIKPRNGSYLKTWKDTEKTFMGELEKHFSNSEFSEFEMVSKVVEHLPKGSILHLANSMSVRYVNYLTIPEGVEVYANRGTSGIDGCTSTAFGAALCTNKLVTLITGDMAFIYDRNALWNNYLPKNLRIVVLNNHGGGIFRIIDGPNRQPELGEYFETHQGLSIKNTVADFDLDYSSIRHKSDTDKVLEAFFMDNHKAKIMEVFTESIVNTTVLKSFSDKFKNI